MAFISFFDTSAMAPMASSRIVIMSIIMGVGEFHVSFFVVDSSCSFWEARMGARAKRIVFFLISFGDEDDT